MGRGSPCGAAAGGTLSLAAREAMWRATGLPDSPFVAARPVTRSRVWRSAICSLVRDYVLAATTTRGAACLGALPVEDFFFRLTDAQHLTASYACAHACSATLADGDLCWRAIDAIVRHAPHRRSHRRAIVAIPKFASYRWRVERLRIISTLKRLILGLFEFEVRSGRDQTMYRTQIRTRGSQESLDCAFIRDLMRRHSYDRAHVTERHATCHVTA